MCQFSPTGENPLMIELHCHILPGVDDGARTMSDALDLVRASIDNGITGAVVTPHIYPGVWDNGQTNLRLALRALQNSIAANRLDFQIVLGAELRVHPDTLARVAARRLPLIGRFEGDDVALLEFPDGSIPPAALQACQGLLAAGIRPLIAHPERNKEVIRDPVRILPFVEAGCLLQVTAASLIGQFGDAALACAHDLIARGIVTVVASDTHNLRSRPPRLREAREALARLYGHGLAHRLTEDVPRQIVEARTDWQADSRRHAGASGAIAT